MSRKQSASGPRRTISPRTVRETRTPSVTAAYLHQAAGSWLVPVLCLAMAAVFWGLAALEVAQAGFVHDLPWGLDTRIGEQGLSLSGGQRQRLALARAVLAKPKVLVLDDTLSALDVHTEKLVEDALRRVLADATGIVVAHRASTVLLADKVALIQDGTITHVGRHSDLLATVRAYRDLLAADVTDDAELEEVSA